LRGARFDAHGAVLEERAFPRGILTMSARAFRAVFAELFGDWMEAAGARC
jgi:2-dehydro-3-deoxygalactonokinase